MSEHSFPPNKYDGKAQANFFYGVEEAAREHALAYGVSAHQILSDLCANLLSCVLIEGTEQEFATLMVKAQDQATRVLQRRAQALDEQADIFAEVGAHVRG